MTEISSRVAHLALLVLAPGHFSPEPTASPAWSAIAGIAVLVAPLVFAFWLVRRFDVLEAKVALGLWILAGAALVQGAHSTLERGAPLLGGYYLAAPLFWAGLGAVFATLAGQYLGTSFKNKRMGAFFLAVAAGFFGFRDAHERIASPSLQWRAVLDSAPAYEPALRSLEGELSRDTEPLQRLLACVAERPNACLCRTLLAEKSLRAGRASEARAHTDAGACAGHPLLSRAAETASRASTMLERHEAAEAHAALGFAADRGGRYEEARREYGEALALEPERADDHHRLVMLHWREGAKGEARAETKRFAERFPRDSRAGTLKALVGAR